MEPHNWDVYYLAGLKQGVSEETAVAWLASRLRVSKDLARKIIRKPNRVIKANQTRSRAEQYRAALDQIGLQVEIRQTTDEPKLPPSPADDSQQQAEAAADAQTDLKLVEKEEPYLPYGDPPPPPAEDDADYEPQPVSKIPVEFHGEGFEYFKIWIVNIFLTIITVGIYSAWAKVRNKRYFYGNTAIDGSSFEYTARPITILKGRLVAVAVFVVYSMLSELVPLLGLLLAVIFTAFIPWLLVRAFKFNSRNTVFRNVRFNFHGGSGEALRVFLLWPLFLLPTFGLILPYLWYRQKAFVVANSSYGTRRFSFHASAGDYYRVLLIAFVVIVVAALVVSGLTLLLGEQAVIVASPLSLIVYIGLFGYVAAALGNLAFNYSKLEPHGFVSRLDYKVMAWLYFSNTLMILLTLGLFIPWAHTRMARYRAACLSLRVIGSLDDFVAEEVEKTSALGEEMGEVFDFDVPIV